MAATELNLGEFTRGDTIYLPFVFRAAGAPVDLRGHTVWFTMKHSPHEDDADATIQISQELGMEDLEAKDGRFTIIVPAATSAAAIPANYHYDLQLVSGYNEEVVATYLVGRIRLRIDVTHRTS